MPWSEQPIESFVRRATILTILLTWRAYRLARSQRESAQVRINSVHACTLLGKCRSVGVES